MAAHEVDHIVPKCKQGDDRMENLQAICRQCHAAKTAREAIEQAMGKPMPFVITRPK